MTLTPDPEDNELSAYEAVSIRCDDADDGAAAVVVEKESCAEVEEFAEGLG